MCCCYVLFCAMYSVFFFVLRFVLFCIILFLVFCFFIVFLFFCSFVFCVLCCVVVCCVVLCCVMLSCHLVALVDKNRGTRHDKDSDSTSSKESITNNKLEIPWSFQHTNIRLTHIRSKILHHSCREKK